VRGNHLYTQHIKSQKRSAWSEEREDKEGAGCGFQGTQARSPAEFGGSRNLRDIKNNKERRDILGLRNPPEKE